MKKVIFLVLLLTTNSFAMMNGGGPRHCKVTSHCTVEHIEGSSGLSYDCETEFECESGAVGTARVANVPKIGFSKLTIDNKYYQGALQATKAKANGAEIKDIFFRVKK